MSRLRDTWRQQAGMKPSAGDYAALNTLFFMGFLFVQFGLGMGTNLFAQVSPHHPGAGATNVFTGAFHSISWAIAHGPVVLAIHVVVGLGLVIGAVHSFLWNYKWGTRGTVWATGAALLLILGAGLSGGAFLTYDKNLYSLLMALAFGAAILCYASVVYLLLLSPEAGKTLRSTRALQDERAVLPSPPS